MILLILYVCGWVFWCWFFGVCILFCFFNYFMCKLKHFAYVLMYFCGGFCRGDFVFLFGVV